MRADVAGGEMTAWRCRAEAEAVPGGLRDSVVRGAEEGRAGLDAAFRSAVISPTAVETLLVKEEMAQPVQEAASLGCGVPIRGVAVEDSTAFGGGKTVSAIVEANLRIRWRYTSIVLLV